MAIATIEGGKIHELKAYGRLDDGQAASLDTIYNVASLTKPVTAMTALKLVAAGKWDLDEPLAHYFIDPDIAGNPYLKELTTRLVLSHRSGFPNWRYLTASKKLAFEFKPGTRFQYSGEGFEYLRKALERKFGKSLDALAKENVFDPWGMTDTHYAFTAGVDLARYAPPHDANGRPIVLAHHTTVNGAANLLTTVSDYTRFMVHVLGGAGLPPALYADMTKPQASVQPDVDYGLGWKVYEKLDGNGEYALQHTGGDDGIKAIAILFPKSKRGLLVISNSENGISLWKKIIEEVFGAPGERLVKLNLGR
jgi:CubicO group peptidase (beta-lactamase class C family)